MKVCIKCKLDKSIDMFGKNNRNKDGLENTCKKCRSIKSKEKYPSIREEYNKNRRKKYSESLEENKKRRREKYIKNSEKILSYQKSYFENNLEYRNKVKEYQKEYHKNNLNYKEYKLKNFDKIKEYGILYRNIPENKKRINKNNTLRHKHRKSRDSLFKLMCSIRSSISNNFKCNGFKKSERTEKILGCSFEEFKLYLESKFDPWMTWENKGLFNSEFNFGWDIDHIIPMSTASTVEDIIKLNHHTNLQPLCSKINREIKSNKIDYEMSI